jgi:hypothetical protein
MGVKVELGALLGAVSGLGDREAMIVLRAAAVMVGRGEGGWSTRERWLDAMGAPACLDPNDAVLSVLSHPEGWGLRPVATAVERAVEVSAARSRAGKSGGRPSRKVQKQLLSDEKQMLSADEVATTYGESNCFPSQKQMLSDKESQRLTAATAVSGEVAPTYRSSSSSGVSGVGGTTVFTLGAVGGAVWEPGAVQIAAWREAYPGVSLEGEFRKMRAWLASNPGRGKTARGMSRFVNSWLSRAVPERPEPRPANDVWSMTTRRGRNG